MSVENKSTPRWSDAARSVWGKSSGYDAEAWLPLVQHLADSADIARRVWSWLPPSTQRAIESGLPEVARDGRVLLSWLAGVHDIGKCSPPFAAKVPILADRMREQGLTFPRDTTEFGKAPHGLVGHAILRRWLRERYGSRPRVAKTYAVVVGGHHGVPPTNAKLAWLADRDHLLGDAAWVAVQDEILDAMAGYTGADAYLTAWAAHPLDPTTQALLTGAVIVSDWLASNTELFPFGTAGSADRAEVAWEELDLPAPWHPVAVPEDPGEHLARRFPGVGTTPRPVQRLTVAAARSAATPPMIIVESTMGSGKTEAALMAAEVLAERFDCGGVYVGLPTMATSDAMFQRVLDWITHLDGSGVASTYLAHGKAGLNDAYQGLRSSGHPYHLATVYDDDLPADHVEARVESWLTGRKKGVLASMVVGTIDQLLFMALQAKHAALRHLAFAGKVVIVDEVHAADDFMRMYLCRALEWLAAYRVPVILLSATLPSGQRQELADAYRAGLGAPSQELPPREDYPLVTTVTADDIVSSADDSPVSSTTVVVHTVDDDLATLTTLLDEWLADGGCVAVIRNTVGRAQDTAAHLRERYGEDVVLHHSRFIATHRAKREKTLRDELGRDGDRPARRIVVGTQVLEQSLDVDFDVMVTDLAPVDLVLQRLGRLHRHPRTRPPRLTTPQLVITGIADWTTEGPSPDRGSQSVYGLSRLLRAAGALDLQPETAIEVAVPTDVRRLVEAAYGEVPPVPASWLARTEAADDAYRTAVAQAKDRADAFRMHSVADLEGSLIGWLEDSSREAEESQGAPRVRDGEDGIEVIVVQRIDGQVSFLDDGSPYAGTQLPTDLDVPGPDLARTLAAMTVGLPASMTRSPADFDRVLDALEAAGHEGWQQSSWLSGDLVLHLDETWKAAVAGFNLSYDLEQGLVAREDTA